MTGAVEPHDVEDILRGWKEIAEYLKVSVKTAQRYEREFGLPVRRKSQQFHSGVYALRSELSSWLEARSKPAEAGPQDKPGRLHFRASRTLLVLGALTVLAVIAFTVESHVSRRGQMASWEVHQNRLLALDSQSRVLWQKPFPYSFEHKLYRDFTGLPHPPVVTEDLDGDGPPELLFIAVDAGAEIARGFYCFNGDGSVRFSVDEAKPIRQTVQFGERRFQPPFEPCLFRIGVDAHGRKSVFVVSQVHSWCPAVVQKYSTKGRLLGEFWLPGHIRLLRDVTFAGRRLLLVGGMNNEHHAASLAVLDYDNPTGHAPASDPYYVCRDCPSGDPLVYVVFPRTEISRAVNSRPSVDRLKTDQPGLLTVIVSEGPEYLGQQSQWFAFVIYQLDEKFNVVNATYH